MSRKTASPPAPTVADTPPTLPGVPSLAQKAAGFASWRPIGDVKPYTKNPRKNSAAVAKVAASIREYGFRQPLVVDDQGVVLVGHTRLLAAQTLGLLEVPVHVAEGLTPQQAKAYRLADNRTGEEAEWDWDLLRLELGELKDADFDLTLTGFDDDELTQAIGGGVLPGADLDAVPEAPVNPITKPGDLIILGRHRLLCGDSTKAEDVARLMDGKRADLVFTDPPYGVGYDGGAKPREALEGDHIGTTIYADSLPHLKQAAADHAALYLWYADAHAAAAAAAAAAAGYAITAQIIWVKNNAQFVTSAHYKGKHEPCFYAHRRGKVARWEGPNNEVTVWEVDRAPKNEYHPTQKPVELCTRAMLNSSRAGDVVLDLFGGSGSTMIGAEAEGRVAYLMELSPAYCDVIVARWESVTGQTAVRP